MNIAIETNHHKNESGLTIESKFKVGPVNEPAILASIVVHYSNRLECSAVHKALLRRIKFAIEETV